MVYHPLIANGDAGYYSYRYNRRASQVTGSREYSVSDGLKVERVRTIRWYPAKRALSVIR